MPAGNLEGLVIERLRTLLCDRGELLDSVGEHGLSGAGVKPLMERARRIAEVLTDRSPGELRLLVMTLVRRVEIRSESIEIEICRQRLTSVLQGHSPGAPHRSATGDTVPKTS